MTPSPALFPPTVAEQIAELERELALRRRVYPDFIARKRLSARAADLQIARIEAAIDTLTRLAASPGDQDRR